MITSSSYSEEFLFSPVFRRCFTPIASTEKSIFIISYSIQQSNSKLSQYNRVRFIFLRSDIDCEIFTSKSSVLFFYFQISLAITGMNAVCPVFFKLISLIEQYHPRVALYWELTRYFLTPFLPMNTPHSLVFRTEGDSQD